MGKKCAGYTVTQTTEGAEGLHGADMSPSLDRVKGMWKKV